MTFVAAHLTLIYLCSIILFIDCLKKVGSEIENGPKITLESYKSETSHKWITIRNQSSLPNFIVKNVNDFSVFSNETSATHILLVCRASYPIYWNSTNVKPNNLNEINTGFKAEFNIDKRNSANSTNPTKFIAYLQLYNEQSFTGLYACRSVDSEKLNSTTYVFLSGIANNSTLLLQAGQDINVGLNGQQSVLLPCKVSQPSTLVQLAKKNVN